MATKYGQNEAVDFHADNLLPLDKSFSNLNGQPLLKAEVWYDYDKLVAFAQSAAAYVGQKVFYVDLDNQKVTHYGIELDGSLKELGAATAGDDKSITLDEDNILSLKNFGKKYYKYVPATETAPATYELVTVDATHPFPAGVQPKTTLAADGKTIELAWYEPSTTTVEGLSAQISTLSEEVDSIDKKIGDENTANTLTKRVKDLEGGKVDKVTGKGLSTEDYTTAEKNKLSGIAAGAQVNKLEGITVNGTAKTPNAQTKIVDITVPTKLSELSNTDTKFINNSVTDLVNYYTKTDTYTKDEVNDLIAGISTLNIYVLDGAETLEDIINPSTTTLYLVPGGGGAGAEGDNIFDEYIWTGSKFECIGTTAADLANCLHKDGNASNTTVTFTADSNDYTPTSGDTLSNIIKKIVETILDLHSVAFSGDYDDLNNTPEYHLTPHFTRLAAGETTGMYRILMDHSACIVTNVTAHLATTGELVMIDHICQSDVCDDGECLDVYYSISSAIDEDINIIITATH